VWRKTAREVRKLGNVSWIPVSCARRGSRRQDVLYLTGDKEFQRQVR